MSVSNYLRKKKVYIWGFGYLGYTAALTMQEHGFHVSVFDFDIKRFEAFENKQYPGDQQKNHWSLRSSIPELDRTRLSLCSEPEKMFEDAPVHLIAMPIMDKGKAKGVNLENLAENFKQHVDGDSLVLFLSVGFPGQIQDIFCKALKTSGATTHVGTAFRRDWVWEEFKESGKPQVLSANTEKGLEKTREFFDLLKIPYSTLGSIAEAEVFENTRNAMNYTATAFINQLALAYPDIDFQKINKLLAEQVDLSTLQLSIGAGGHRMQFSVDALIAGSTMPECLSILTEAESVNFSTVLSYSDYLARKGYKSVLIMGITNRENQKDMIAISPSLTLAETMSNRGLKVYVNDPHYPDEEMRKLIPFCEPAELDSLPQDLDAVLVMSAHSQYRCLSQEKLDSIFHDNIKLIIDNPGIYSGYQFSSAAYHQVGDGKINILK